MAVSRPRPLKLCAIYRAIALPVLLGLHATASLHAIADTTLKEPGCTALTAWAQGLDPAATFAPAAGLTVNERFQNAIVEPLFGVPFMNWQNDDTTALQNWLTNCRREAAAAQNTAASNALYAMVKETRNAYKQLRRVWSAEKMVTGTVARISELKPDADTAALMSIAIAALQGDDVTSEVQGLPPRWTGYGRQAAQLADFAPLLSAERRAAFIDLLEQSSESAKGIAAERSVAQTALLSRIAEVPATQAGLNELYAIARTVEPGTMSPEDYRAYDSALQAKRAYVQSQLEAQAAAEEAQRRSQPAPVITQINALLIGEEVDGLEFRDLPMNGARGRLSQVVQQGWGLKQTPSLSYDETEFAITNNAMAALMKSERRSGGALALRTHQGRVGQIQYTEHYPGPVLIEELEAYLLERFGKPDERTGSVSFAAFAWRDGNRRLQISAGARIAQHLQNRGVQSSVTLLLQDTGFLEYLEDAAQRCEKLRNKPRDRLSTEEAQALVMGCLEP